MDKPLTLEDIDEKVRPQVYTQDYSPQKLIDGVKIVSVKPNISEEGNFVELLRLDVKGVVDQFPEFCVAQINRSTQFPGSVKAWHLHFAQDEIWYVPPESHLVAGLWDVRKGSPTRGATMKIVVGGSTNRLLYIPHGVAHGSINHSQNLGIIIYFVNKQFNLKNPDEHRIPWDAQGRDFWLPERD